MAANGTQRPPCPAETTHRSTQDQLPDNTCLHLQAHLWSSFKSMHVGPLLTFLVCELVGVCVRHSNDMCLYIRTCLCPATALRRPDHHMHNSVSYADAGNTKSFPTSYAANKSKSGVSELIGRQHAT